jgi:hypothetical protein
MKLTLKLNHFFVQVQQKRNPLLRGRNVVVAYKHRVISMTPQCSLLGFRLNQTLRHTDSHLLDIELINHESISRAEFAMYYIASRNVHTVLRSICGRCSHLELDVFQLNFTVTEWAMLLQLAHMKQGAASYQSYTQVEYIFDVILSAGYTAIATNAHGMEIPSFSNDMNIFSCSMHFRPDALKDYLDNPRSLVWENSCVFDKYISDSAMNLQSLLTNCNDMLMYQLCLLWWEYSSIVCRSNAALCDLDAYMIKSMNFKFYDVDSFVGNIDVTCEVTKLNLSFRSQNFDTEIQSARLSFLDVFKYLQNNAFFTEPQLYSKIELLQISTIFIDADSSSNLSEETVPRLTSVTNNDRSEVRILIEETLPKRASDDTNRATQDVSTIMVPVSSEYNSNIEVLSPNEYHASIGEIWGNFDTNYNKDTKFSEILREVMWMTKPELENLNKFCEEMVNRNTSIT